MVIITKVISINVNFKVNPIDDVLKDIQVKYDSSINKNLQAGTVVTELEMLLEAERRKAKELREKLEHDLDNERKARIDFENKLLRLKNEAGNREMYVSELDYKVFNLLLKYLGQHFDLRKRGLEIRESRYKRRIESFIRNLHFKNKRDGR